MTTDKVSFVMHQSVQQGRLWQERLRNLDDYLLVLAVSNCSKFSWAVCEANVSHPQDQS